MTTADGGQAFTYESGSFSTLAVAFSATLSGKFTAKGSGGVEVKGSTDNTTNFGQVDGVHSYKYLEQFKYGKFRLSCSEVTGGTRSHVIGYYLRPIAFAGPGNRVAVPAISATHCSPLAFNSGYSKKGSTATTYTGGVDLSNAQASLSVSSTSGYTTAVEAIFRNNSKSVNHSLCGTKDTPGGKAGRLVLK